MTDKEAAAQRAKHIESLETERDNYLAQGRKDRAKEVEAELARWGQTKPKATTESSKPKQTREA